MNVTSKGQLMDKAEDVADQVLNCNWMCKSRPKSFIHSLGTGLFVPLFVPLVDFWYPGRFVHWTSGYLLVVYTTV